jgi:hypothetical protein
VDTQRGLAPQAECRPFAGSLDGDVLLRIVAGTIEEVGEFSASNRNIYGRVGSRIVGSLR